MCTVDQLFKNSESSIRLFVVLERRRCPGDVLDVLDVLLLFEDLLRTACSCSVSCGGLDDGGVGGREGRCGGGKGSVASGWVGLCSMDLCFFFFFFLVLFCDCLWNVTVEYCCARSTRAVVVQEIRCIKF